MTQTPQSSEEAERVLWKKAQPGIALWPKLLPKGPNDAGYQDMACEPTDKRTARTKVLSRYVLRCVASERGYDEPTVTVDVFSYAPGKAEKALQARGAAQNCAASRRMTSAGTPVRAAIAASSNGATAASASSRPRRRSP